MKELPQHLLSVTLTVLLTAYFNLCCYPTTTLAAVVCIPVVLTGEPTSCNAGQTKCVNYKKLGSASRQFVLSLFWWSLVF